MEGKTYQIGKQILREHDLQFPVEYNGDVFLMQLPTPLMVSQIEAEIAQRLGGMPRESYSGEHVARVTATCYVNNLVVSAKCPVWFESAWTCLDEGLIATLYEGYLSFRSEFQKKLKQGEFRDGGKGGGA